MRILDAGCGTGLCGVFLKKYASFRGLEGVDLSAGMLREAAAKKVYNKLICREITDWLNNVKARYGLVVSADVFTYIGDLENLFSALFGALKKNGRVIFTVSENSLNDSDWFLHISGRFLHRREYIEKLLLQIRVSSWKKSAGKNCATRVIPKFGDMSLPRGNKVSDKRISPTKKPLCPERFFPFFQLQKNAIILRIFWSKKRSCRKNFCCWFLGGSSALLGAARKWQTCRKKTCSC